MQRISPNNSLWQNKDYLPF